VRVAFERGSARLCGVGESSDVTIVAPGFRTVHVEDVRGSRRMELEPGFDVRVRVPDALNLPQGEVELRLYFWNEAQPRGRSESVYDSEGRNSSLWGGPLVIVALDENRLVDLVLPESGDWVVDWVLVVPTPDGRKRAHGVHSAKATSSFVVPANGSPVDVLLSPDLDELTRMLREIELR
jgi:hypothetical protein